jgi:hypothetical protein
MKIQSLKDAGVKVPAYSPHARARSIVAGSAMPWPFQPQEQATEARPSSRAAQGSPQELLDK